MLKRLPTTATIVCIFLCSTNAAGQSEIHEYLRSHGSGGALFTGSIAGAGIHMALWPVPEGQTSELGGYYFYDKYHVPGPDGEYTNRRIELTGSLTGEDGASLRLMLSESVDGTSTGSMQATYSPQTGEFSGMWSASAGDREHDFTLQAGGSLPIHASPDAVVEMSSQGTQILLNGNVTLPLDSYELVAQTCVGCGIEYSFETIDGVPEITVFTQSYYGGRVPSHDVTYVVDGAAEPFLRAGNSGNHWCAGGTGGRNNHEFEYEPPNFDVTFQSVSWDECEIQDGYYVNQRRIETARYVLATDGSGSRAVEDPRAATTLSSLVLSRPDGESVFFKLTAENLFWGGQADTGRSYQPFQFGQGSPFGFSCWLYGTGSTDGGAPSSDAIEPVWRNLDLQTSWEKFVTATRNGLLSTKAWTFFVDEDEVRLRLNGVDVARYDKSADRCHSLYVRNDTDAVVPY